MNCKCGQPAITKICRKEGANYGRSFLSCSFFSSSQNPGCGFFKWVSDEPKRSSPPIQVPTKYIRPNPPKQNNFTNHTTKTVEERLDEIEHELGLSGARVMMLQHKISETNKIALDASSQVSNILQITGLVDEIPKKTFGDNSYKPNNKIKPTEKTFRQSPTFENEEDQFMIDIESQYE